MIKGERMEDKNKSCQELLAKVKYELLDRICLTLEKGGDTEVVRACVDSYIALVKLALKEKAALKKSLKQTRERYGK